MMTNTGIPEPSRGRPLSPLPVRRHVAQAASRVDGSGQTAFALELVGGWIQRLRVQAGMSQGQLARRSGLHQSTISRLERGRLEGLRLHRLALLLAVLDGATAELSDKRR